MWRRLSLIVVTCAGLRAAASEPAPPAAPEAAPTIAVSGHVVDREPPGDPLPGATIVIRDAAGEQVAITDEAGDFTLTAHPGAITVTVYYLDGTTERSVDAPAGAAFELGPIAVDTRPRPGDDQLVMVPSVELSVSTTAALTATWQRGAWPTSRRRDAAALGALPPTLASALTTLDHARRLGTALPIALGLLEQAQVIGARGGAELDGRQSGVALDSAAGTNEIHASARAAADVAPDARPAAEVSLGAPLVHDHLWAWLGGVRDDGDAQALARLDAAVTTEEHGHLVALHQEAPAALRDDWLSAEWESLHDDRKIDAVADATGERLATAAGDTTRAALRTALTARRRLAGYQSAQAFAEAGAGDALGVAHRDVAAGVRDRWDVTSASLLDVGVRYDARWYGRAHAAVWQPAATVAWDWTHEGRAEVFVTAARTARLDDGAIGAWAAPLGALPGWRDDALAGVRYEVRAGWVASLAARGADEGGVRRTGAEAWLDYQQFWWELHLAASSLDRAVMGWTRVSAGDLRASVSARLAGRDDRIGTQAAGSVGWRVRLGRRHELTPAAELLSDRAGTTLRAVVTAAF